VVLNIAVCHLTNFSLIPGAQDGGSRFVQSIGIYLQDCTVSWQNSTIWVVLIGSINTVYQMNMRQYTNSGNRVCSKLSCNFKLKPQTTQLLFLPLRCMSVGSILAQGWLYIVLYFMCTCTECHGQGLSHTWSSCWDFLFWSLSLFQGSAEEYGITDCILVL
jgi:hypothetical protein